MGKLALFLPILKPLSLIGGGAFGAWLLTAYPAVYNAMCNPLGG